MIIFPFIYYYFFFFGGVSQKIYLKIDILLSVASDWAVNLLKTNVFLAVAVAHLRLTSIWLTTKWFKNPAL